jgi:acetyl-CoA carboxylase biotin carboxyl carrier protein
VTDTERDDGAGALLALVDRLGVLLDENDLAELEVEADGTRVVLRRGAGVAPAPGAAHGSPTGPAVGVADASEPVPGSMPASARVDGDQSAPDADAASTLVPVISPLTGVFYGSPAPGSAPYVQVGGEVAVGQVIGLVEAMKLFNEIKSQVAGRVVRVVAESGDLVKAKQPLIEVEPL